MWGKKRSLNVSALGGFEAGNKILRDKDFAPKGDREKRENEHNFMIEPTGIARGAAIK
jgi:hypothetical protein